MFNCNQWFVFSSKSKKKSSLLWFLFFCYLLFQGRSEVNHQVSATQEYLWRDKEVELIACEIPFELIRDSVYDPQFSIDSDWVQQFTPHHPFVIIPGLASSVLVSWKSKDCTGLGPMDIYIGERVWISAPQILYDAMQSGCWIDCIKLNGSELEDPSDCKLRSESGLRAITVLDPGLITGPLSSVFQEFIEVLATYYGYDTQSLVPLPYDWRLSPSKLEQRDRFFTQMRLKIENMVHISKLSVVVIGHSLGNNVFEYFVEWIYLKLGKTQGKKWVEIHVEAYIAVGSPQLGSSQAIHALLSGQTFGLPISDSSAREMSATFGSGPWLLPLASTFQNAPVPPLAVEYLALNETIIYNPKDISNGQLFRDLARFDPISKKMLDIFERHYLSPKLELLPLEIMKHRPNISTIYCVYGINLPTEVGYKYTVTPTGRVILDAKVIEKQGGVIDVQWVTSPPSNPLLQQHPEWLIFLNKNHNKSGDGTVPYHSLSHCQSWHLGKIEEKTIVRNPISSTPSFMDILFSKNNRKKENDNVDVELKKGSMKRFDSQATIGERLWRTTVIELNGVDHRNIVRDEEFILFFLREAAASRTVCAHTARPRQMSQKEQDHEEHQHSNNNKKNSN